MEDARKTSVPLLVVPEADTGAAAAAAIAADRRGMSAERLPTSGARLFRGFDLGTVEAFGAVVDAFSGSAPLFDYAGGASPRRAIAGAGRGPYSSTEYPPGVELWLHNELSYTDRQPPPVRLLPGRARAGRGDDAGRQPRHPGALQPIGRGKTQLMGRLCMEHDIIASNVQLPGGTRVGDLLIFCDAGGYDRSMSYVFGRG